MNSYNNKSLITVAGCFLLSAAFLFANDLSYKPFEQKPLGDSIFVEHAAFAGNYENLGGPARQAMVRSLWGAGTDTLGNIFFVDRHSNAIGVIRKADKMVFWISGNEGIIYGSPALPEGPAYRLRLGCSGSNGIPYHRIMVVGNPLAGAGSVYVADVDANAIVRIYRNAAQNNMWWYERIAGMGSVTAAAGVAAATIRLADPIIALNKENVLGIVPQQAVVMYWMRNGLLEEGFNPALMPLSGTGWTRKSACYGIDVDGQYICYSGIDNTIKIISSDGQSVAGSCNVPYEPCWGLFPDFTRKDWCFLRGMDDYSINRINLKTGAFGVLLTDGSWGTKSVGNGTPANMLGWSRGLPLADGRIAGWSAQMGGSSPLFILSFLDSANMTSVHTGNLVPAGKVLLSCFPNPFNADIRIRLCLPQNDEAKSFPIRLTVFNMQGRLVRDFPLDKASVGDRSIAWNTQSQAPGIYVVQLRLGQEVFSQRISLLR